MSVFPTSVGVWLYDNTHSGGMKAWMEASGFGWMQFYDMMWASRLMPYVPEVKTSQAGNKHDSAQFQARLAVMAADADCFGFNVDCEVPRTTETALVVAEMREHAPTKSVLTGPLPWSIKEQTYFDGYDGVMTFYNFTREDRDPRDFWLFYALAAYYEKPFCMSVQITNHSSPIEFANASLFAEAMLLTSEYADGACLWAADDLWQVASGYKTATNPSEVGGIITVVGQTRMARKYRPPLVVYLTGNDKTDRVLCRVVGDAGFAPIATNLVSAAQIKYTELVFGAAYGAAYTAWWAGTGSRETMRALEAAAALKVKERFGSPLPPVEDEGDTGVVRQTAWIRVPHPTGEVIEGYGEGGYGEGPYGSPLSSSLIATPWRKVG